MNAQLPLYSSSIRSLISPALSSSSAPDYHASSFASVDEDLADMQDFVVPRLRQYLNSQLRDRKLAEELLQQTLRRMRFGFFMHGPGSVAWAFAIARRLVIVAVLRGAR
jgi:hypothetical protein